MGRPILYLRRIHMTVFRAQFDGQVLIPDGPVSLPTGCPLDVHVIPIESNQGEDLPLQRLADLLTRFPANPGSPTDGAAEHDHYLYGTPKRS